VGRTAGGAGGRGWGDSGEIQSGRLLRAPGWGGGGEGRFGLAGTCPPTQPLSSVRALRGAERRRLEAGRGGEGAWARRGGGGGHLSPALRGGGGEGGTSARPSGGEGGRGRFSPLHIKRGLGVSFS
jgi:hypothetical protein